MPHQGTLFILVGPSGAGKNTLMKRVQARLGDLPQLATVTTRAIRPGEQEGREHRFVSHDEFQRLIQQNALLEYQQVHMNDLYGTPRATVEDAIRADRDLIADIEFLGADQVYQAFPDHTVLIFVTPSRLDLLAERIQKRGDISPEVLQNRLHRARFEMTFALRCHYLVLNDELAPATTQLWQIITGERACRRPSPGTPATAAGGHTIRGSVSALVRAADRLLVRATPDAGTLPTFPVIDPAILPHETLKTRLTDALGASVIVGAISDSRFDFVAPDYVTIAAPPPDARLHFYYTCHVAGGQRLEFAGWEWRPLDTLNLPAGLRDAALSGQQI